MFSCLREDAVTHTAKEVGTQGWWRETSVLTRDGAQGGRAMLPPCAIVPPCAVTVFVLCTVTANERPTAAKGGDPGLAIWRRVARKIVSR